MTDIVNYANWVSYFNKNMYLTGVDQLASKMHHAITDGAGEKFIEQYEAVITRLCKNVTIKMALKSVNVNFLLLKLYEADMFEGMEYILKRNFPSYRTGSKKNNIHLHYAELISRLLQNRNNGGFKTLKHFTQSHKLSESIVDLGYSGILKEKIFFHTWDAVEYLTEPQWKPKINKLEDMTHAFHHLIELDKVAVYEKIFSQMNMGALQMAAHRNQNSFLSSRQKDELQSVLDVYLERTIILHQIKEKESDITLHQSKATFKV